MRKLASIRRISDIQPIPDADMIHVVTVDGWKVVAQKAMGYKVGDLVVYFEIDSFIPTEIAPFLTKDAAFPKEFNGVKGERLRTIRLKGQISQGLLMPLSAIPGYTEIDGKKFINTER
jgi:RNA ligase (TIGR02306 family)